MTSETAFKPIKLSVGNISLELLPQGATIHRIEVTHPTTGAKRDVICGPEDPKGHVLEGRKFLTQLVGRYANRLPGGKTVVEGKKGSFEINLDANEGGKNCLHSGNNGYDIREFSPLEDTSPLVTTLFDRPYPTSASLPIKSQYLHLTSPSGDQGFPGALDVVAKTSVSAPRDHVKSSFGTLVGTVEYDVRAKLGEGVDSEKGTPVNMTLHSGYVLSDFANREEGVKDHKLWINSTRTVDIDPALLPTGSLVSTTQTPLDASQGDWGDATSFPNLASFMAPSGIDHCYVFDSFTSTKPQAILQSPSRDLSLVFKTNQSAVQVYTFNGGDGSGTRKALHGDVSKGYKKQDAMMLEFQHPNGTCLHKDLQKAAKTDTILYPGEVYINNFSVEIWQK